MPSFFSSRNYSLWPLVVLMLMSCGAEVGPNGNINPDLGHTEMTQCRYVSGVDIGFEGMISKLEQFAGDHDMKFLNEQPRGAYGSYLQIDVPYVIVSHSYFLYREPPEHIFTLHRQSGNAAGLQIEMDLLAVLGTFPSVRDCGGYTSSISRGWRLKDQP